MMSWTSQGKGPGEGEGAEEVGPRNQSLSQVPIHLNPVPAHLNPVPLHLYPAQVHLNQVQVCLDLDLSRDPLQVQ